MEEATKQRNNAHLEDLETTAELPRLHTQLVKARLLLGRSSLSSPRLTTGLALGSPHGLSSASPSFHSCRDFTSFKKLSLWEKTWSKTPAPLLLATKKLSPFKGT